MITTNCPKCLNQLSLPAPPIPGVLYLCPLCQERFYPKIQALDFLDPIVEPPSRPSGGPSKRVKPGRGRPFGSGDELIKILSPDGAAPTDDQGSIAEGLLTHKVKTSRGWFLKIFLTTFAACVMVVFFLIFNYSVPPTPPAPASPPRRLVATSSSYADVRLSSDLGHLKRFYKRNKAVNRLVDHSGPELRVYGHFSQTLWADMCEKPSAIRLITNDSSAQLSMLALCRPLEPIPAYIFLKWLGDEVEVIALAGDTAKSLTIALNNSSTPSGQNLSAIKRFE
ncbi:MAG: hypothetical protein LBV23_06610 [Deltaproteobacteria bacterium]|jgi:hypothetical protein|nr:hypothetical protein [Deltaproteobacteria bacterium]